MCGFLKCLIDQIDLTVSSKIINTKVKINIFKNNILINLIINNLRDIYFFLMWRPHTDSNREPTDYKSVVADVSS